MRLKIFYPVIDGEISGGNIIALRIIEEALRRKHEVIVNSPSSGKLTDILREKKIKVYNVNTARSFNFINSLKLAIILRKESINLVHSHVPLGGEVLIRLAGWFAGVSVINHEHGLSPLNANYLIRRYQLFLNSLSAKISRSASIAVSEDTRAGVIRRGISPQTVSLIYNGIFSEEKQAVSVGSRGEAAREFSVSLSAPLVGQIGRLDKNKGQDILIAATQRVLKEFPNAVFFIVGEDFQNNIYRKQLEGMADSLNVGSHIIFTGYRADIQDLMNMFDLFVLPSRKEGLAVVILEAMAARKAVIAANVGGNAEVVVDGQTGTLIPPDNTERLAEAIIWHLKNPQASKAMGEKGYRRVKEYFSLSRMMNKIFDVYEQITRGRK